MVDTKQAKTPSVALIAHAESFRMREDIWAARWKNALPESSLGVSGQQAWLMAAFAQEVNVELVEALREGLEDMRGYGSPEVVARAANALRKAGAL